MIFRSSVLGGRRHVGSRRRAPSARWEPGGPRVLAHSIFTSLPFLRSCGGAGKRRGLASGARVIGCPGSLARAVWSSPGGEGRSGHCSNHSHHGHSRSRRSLGRRQVAPSRCFLGAPTRTRASRSARSAPEPCPAATLNRLARAKADPTLCTVPRPNPGFSALNSLGLRLPLSTMTRVSALGALVPLLLPLLLLLLPLPRDAGGLGERSEAAWDYSALEGEEGAEQQLEHYHDPCKAGRCRGGSPAEVCL